MLPLPGSPAASWAMFKQKMRAALSGTNARVAIAFFLFGLLNNVFGMTILSAALDLVGPEIPKGTVLLATIFPGVCTKLTLPYVIHIVPYSYRTIAFSTLTTVGMLIVALTPSYQTDPDASFGMAVGAKVGGIVLVSLSSGAGELSFLGLTHYYGNTALAAWGSGTGAAGLFGAGIYAIVTGPLGLSVKTTLLGNAVWPFVMVFTFYAILPQGPLKLEQPDRRSSGTSARPSFVRTDSYLRRLSGRDTETMDEDDEEDLARSDHGLLAGPHRRALQEPSRQWSALLRANLRRLRDLIVPYMLPLFIVYVAEYTINQGITPTLLFPLPSDSAPFTHYREFYPAYATIYQVGVFISRSSIFFPSLRFHVLYLPSFLQVANLLFLVAHSVWNFLPNVWVIFLVIFWEGLLGGGVYVNTFAEILEHVPEEDREFSLGATSVSDSLGIMLAALISMVLEVSLCNHQVQEGRNYCKQL